MKDIRQRTFTAACLVGLALLLTAAPSVADQVILDDLIVDGSACVGFDCVNGESFGFDTIRLKENNLRIHFNDTSTASSYPDTDWRIVINDSANGGGHYFAVEDASSGRVPFKIEASARTNSLYIDDGGRLGLRTSTPSTEIHTIDGDTPTLRLQQDGSSGFAPQTWDVAGNETNFFIRDVTNGSTLPIRLRPGAPTSAIDIAATGDVGVGTGAPSREMHLRRTDASSTSFLIENAAGSGQNTQFILENSEARWDFRNNSVGQFVILSGGSTEVFRIDDGTGDVTVTNELFVNGAGGCTGCDEVFDPGYFVPPIEEHAAEMWEKGYLPGIGPSPVEQPINVFRKTAGILNELEKAHIYIEQLHERVERLEAALAALAAAQQVVP